MTDNAREYESLYYFDKTKVSEYYQIATCDFVSIHSDRKIYCGIIE